VTLVVFGFKEALIVGILKSLLFTLVTGSVSSLFYSLTGTVFSSIAMFIVYLYFSKFFSLIGVSIFGAVAHNTAQVLVSNLIIYNFNIFSYLPILFFINHITGLFTGLSSIFIS